MTEVEIRNLRTLFKNGETDKIAEFKAALAAKSAAAAGGPSSATAGGAGGAGADAAGGDKAKEAWEQVHI